MRDFGSLARLRAKKQVGEVWNPSPLTPPFKGGGPPELPAAIWLNFRPPSPDTNGAGTTTSRCATALVLRRSEERR